MLALSCSYSQERLDSLPRDLDGTLNTETIIPSDWKEWKQSKIIDSRVARMHADGSRVLVRDVPSASCE